MNILHVGKYYFPAVGGMEKALREMASAQLEQGHAVTILVHHHQPGRGSVHETIDAVPVIRAASLGEAVYTPISPAFPVILRRLATATPRPDVIHLHLPNVSAFFALTLPRAIPLVIQWQSDVTSSVMDRRLGFFYNFYRHFESSLLRRAKAIIATSPQYLESSATLRPFRDKCRVAPLGIDLEAIPRPSPEETASARARFPAGRFVLAAGRFTYYKGFEYLIQAARHLPEATVVIAGDGPLRPGMLRLAGELGLSDRVFLPGRVSDADLHALMSACDVFCLPSVERTEAFGMVLLEAMAHGKPLVTTDIPGSGVGFVNAAGEVGLIAPLKDPEGLAATLELILNNQDLRREMGIKAKARVNEVFAHDKTGRAVEHIYREAMAASSH